MNFNVLNFGLLNFDSDSLIWKVSVKRCIPRHCWKTFRCFDSSRIFISYVLIIAKQTAQRPVAIWVQRLLNCHLAYYAKLRPLADCMHKKGSILCKV